MREHSHDLVRQGRIAGGQPVGAHTASEQQERLAVVGGGDAVALQRREERRDPVGGRRWRDRR